MTKDDLVEAINEALDCRQCIDNEKHCMHHEFLQGIIDANTARKKMYDSIATSVIQWGAVSLLAYLATHLQEIYAWIHNK